MNRRALAALLAILLAGVALAACGSSDGRTGDVEQRSTGGGAALGVSDPQRVLVLGDSNLYETGAQVGDALRQVGLEPTSRGVPGYGLKDLAGYWLGELPGLLAGDPDAVVVALGTNDTTTTDDVVQFAARLDEMMQTLGDRPVVWVTHVDPRPGQVSGGAASVNAAIRAAPARWPNLTVLDRTAELTDDPSLLRDDHLHFTPAGMTTFAQEIAAAARARVPAS